MKNEDKNAFPHDFKYWHNVRIDEKITAKALEDEQKRTELYAKFRTVAENICHCNTAKQTIWL